MVVPAALRTAAALLTLVSALALAGTAVAAPPTSPVLPGPLYAATGKLVPEPFPPGQGPPRLKEKAVVAAFLRVPKVADWVDPVSYTHLTLPTNSRV